VNSRPLVEVPERPQLLQAQPGQLPPVDLHWGVLNVVSTSATSTALGVFSKASNLTNYFPSWLGYKRRRTTVAGGDESAMNPRRCCVLFSKLSLGELPRTKENCREQQTVLVLSTRVNSLLINFKPLVNGF
jgi:hypothetical protein